MIPSNAPPGYNTPGYAHSPIPLAGDQCPEKHPKSADQADEQPIPPLMWLLIGRCSSTVLILDIPHRINSPYQKPLCCGASPYSKQCGAIESLHDCRIGWSPGQAFYVPIHFLQHTPNRRIKINLGQNQASSLD